MTAYKSLRLFSLLTLSLFPAAQSSADYPETIIADEPVIYYRFEEDSGADSLQDSSGNDLHSVDLQDVLLEQDGAIGKAAGFEGIGSILTGLILDPSETDFSIELLVKPSDFMETQVLVSNQDGFGTGRSNMIVGATGNINSFMGGSTTPSETIAEIDTWYHVVMTYDAEGPDTIHFYIDGEPSGIGTSIAEPADGNWVIGSHKNRGSQFTDGLLDEVSIYDYRLDDPDGDDDTADSKVTSHYEQYLAQSIVIADFSSDKERLSAGESATLSWSVGDVESLTIDNEIGDVLARTINGKGSIEVTPATTTTYILSGGGPSGNETAEVTIVVDPPPTITSFTGSAEALVIGQTLTLSWSTSDADSVAIEPGIGSVDATGSRDIEFSADVTYTLTATNENGAVTSKVTVTSKPAPPSLGDSLVAHWRIGESPGETNGDVLISDIDEEHNATFEDAPTWVSADLAPTETTAAVEFDGEVFADSASYGGIAGAADRTISFWIKGDDGQNSFATLVSWGTGATSTRWDIRIGGSLNIRTEVAGSGSEGTAQILDGEWHHVAVVFANDETPNIGDIVFYVDGESDELSLVGNTEVNTSDANPVRIGAAFTLADRGFTGQLDDIRIYDRELSQEEIAVVMAGDSAGSGSPFVITDFSYDGTKTVLTWNSVPGQTFGIDTSSNLKDWGELNDGVEASDGTTTTYEDAAPAVGETYYRARLEP